MRLLVVVLAALVLVVAVLFSHADTTAHPKPTPTIGVKYG